MFRPSVVCLSALSKRTKRVRVQLLKDFPAFQVFKGQVADVKPSLMRNYFHNYNGARYILNESDIDITLLDMNNEREAKLKEAMAAKIDSVVNKSTSPVKKFNEEVIKKIVETKEVPKGILDNGITIDKVNIPGLEL